MDVDVGKIDGIRIWHDNSGSAAGWFLSSVVVRKKYSSSRTIASTFVKRLEEISQAYYRHGRVQLKKASADKNAGSERRRDARSREDSDISSNDRLGSNRSILRSPIMSKSEALQKKVSWGESTMSSQEKLSSANVQRAREQRRRPDDSPPTIESGHIEHASYWISSHRYAEQKWKIKSLEESNALDLDPSTRSLLLSDRAAAHVKARPSDEVNDDDTYEFEANRWLAKDEEDRQIEVTLKPKSSRLSTQSTNESKSPPAADARKKSPVNTERTSLDPRSRKLNDEYIQRSSPRIPSPIERSPRALASLDRSLREPSPRELSRTVLGDTLAPSRPTVNTSGAIRRAEPTASMKSTQRPTDSSYLTDSDRDLLAKLTGELPPKARPTTGSVFEGRSSPNLRSAPHPLAARPLATEQDWLSRRPTESLARPKSAARTIRGE